MNASAQSDMSVFPMHSNLRYSAICFTCPRHTVWCTVCCHWSAWRYWRSLRWPRQHWRLCTATSIHSHLQQYITQLITLLVHYTHQSMSTKYLDQRSYPTESCKTLHRRCANLYVQLSTLAFAKQMPLLWKKASLLPVPKVNPPVSTESDIQLISLMPTVTGSWILDLVGKQLDDHQFGALKGRSMTQALVDMLHHWHRAVTRRRSLSSCAVCQLCEGFRSRRS